jgi:hypothetical protein
MKGFLIKFSIQTIFFSFSEYKFRPHNLILQVIIMHYIKNE